MAYCSACGAETQSGVKFCPKCGAAVPEFAPAGAAPAAMEPGAQASASSGEFLGLGVNAASALAYLLGWLTGLIFFIGDKRPAVRFHAAQSILVFGILHVLRWIVLFGLGANYFAFGLAGLGPSFILYKILDLAGVILWIVLMVKAWQGERWKLPVVGDWAESLVGKS